MPLLISLLGLIDQVFWRRRRVRVREERRARPPEATPGRGTPSAAAMVPARAEKTYRPGSVDPREWVVRPVIGLPLRKPPLTAEPGSSKENAAEPLEYPARAELPPRPLPLPLAWPVSHWMES